MNWLIAIGYIIVITIIYLLVGYLWTLRLTNRQKLEDRIFNANDIDELLDLENLCKPYPALLKRLHKKIDNINK